MEILCILILILHSIAKESATNETKNETKKLTERQVVILNLIAKNGSLSQMEMSQITSISFATLKREVAYLQKEGYISREGGRTYGKWVVCKRY